MSQTAVGRSLIGGYGRFVLLPAAIATLAAFVCRYHHWSMVDLGVYRQAASEVVHGRSIYAPRPGLPFTYPPFAALLLVPTAVMSKVDAAVAVTVVSFACYLLFIRTFGRSLGLASGALTLVTVCGLAFEPISHTLELGQINLWLMALVTADTLAMPPRHRGWLTGFAAGLKLTPAIFVVYFLLRREYAAVSRAAGGFAITVLVSGVVLAHDTIRYWTSLFFQPDRVGGASYAGNQSLYGDLSRLTHAAHPAGFAYLAVSLVAISLATLATRRQLEVGRSPQALCCIALGGLLVSPISWTHHWIWLLAVALAFAVDGRWVSVVVLTAIAVVAPMWFTPLAHEREFHDAWWQVALCLSYTIVGLAYLITMLFDPTQRGRRTSARRDGLCVNVLPRGIRIPLQRTGGGGGLHRTPAGRGVSGGLSP